MMVKISKVYSNKFANVAEKSRLTRYNIQSGISENKTSSTAVGVEHMAADVIKKAIFWS